MRKNEWRTTDEKNYLSSLWILDREDDRKLEFHGSFIPAVAEGLMLRHTQPGDWVWDCFAGSGTTGIVADELQRHCLLTDLNPTSEDIYPCDARSVFSKQQFDLVIAHPPYHNIIQFSDSPDDLSNCPNVNIFLAQFSAVCQNINRHLKPGGFLGLVIGDIWITREQAKGTTTPYGYYPLGFRCMDVAMKCIDSAVLTAVVVKNISGNRHNAHRENLVKARLFKIGATQFNHEYIFSIRKG